MYSKERNIYTSSSGNTEPYLELRPWYMQCDRFQTTCTIALAMQGCGWRLGEKKCPKYYGDEQIIHNMEKENRNIEKIVAYWNRMC